jgi:hypothetical protein
MVILHSKLLVIRPGISPFCCSFKPYGPIGQPPNKYKSTTWDFAAAEFHPKAMMPHEITCFFVKSHEKPPFFTALDPNQSNVMS